MTASNDRDRPRGPDRDRDAAGRPRNARGRDGLGRPLPRDAPYPAPAADDGSLVVSGPGDAAALGGALLLAGRPFHAHEVFEDAWKTAAGADRDLWRGLAQVAVGLTHARRGNARGAIALLGRGAARLREFAAASPARDRYGIDVAHLAAAAGDLAARIERDGLDCIPPDAFALATRPGPG